MGKSRHSKYKDYFSELKEEIKKDSNKNKEKDPEFDREVKTDLKQELNEEKKILTISFGSILILLLLFALIGSLLYFSFHKKIEKKLNDFIDSIPITDSKESNGSKNNNSNNNENNLDNQTSNNCTSTFDGVYIFGGEKIKLVSGGYYEKSLNGIMIATGLYTVQNKTIVADVIYEDDTINAPTLTYSITKDCKKITEVSTGKVFVRK